jgi:hypothetical protein
VIRFLFLFAMGCSTAKVPEDLAANGAGNSDSDSDENNGDSDVVYLPALAVHSPQRGLMVEPQNVVLEGWFSPLESGGAAVLSQGLSTDVSGQDFSRDLALNEGPNLIETIATVDGEAVASDHRTVLVGDFDDPDNGLMEGFVFHLAPTALDALGEDASRFFRGQDLTDMIENPVMNEVAEVCFFMCYTMWGVTMNVGNPGFSDIVAEFEPTDDGMWASFTMYDFSMDWWGGGVVSEMGYSADGSMTTEAMRVDMFMTMEWTDTLVVEIQSVSVGSVGFEMDSDDMMMQAMSFFGVPMEPFAASIMEDVFASMLVEQVPVAAREAIAMAAIRGEVDLMPETLAIIGDVAGISVSSSGVDVKYVTVVEPSVVVHDGDHPGRWLSGQPTPVLGDAERVQAGMHLDFVNQVFHGAWAAGAIDKVFPGEILGLTSSVIGSALPGVGMVEVYAEALLPPVMTPGDGGVGRLTLGDLVLRVVPTGEPVDEAVMEIVVNLAADLNLNVEGLFLVPELSNVSAHATIAKPVELSQAVSETIQITMDHVAQEQFPILLGAMFKLPLDIIDGYRLVDATVVATGEGMFMIEGGLQPVSSPGD